jgi:hypothetical protein
VCIVRNIFIKLLFRQYKLFVRQRISTRSLVFDIQTREGNSFQQSVSKTSNLKPNQRYLVVKMHFQFVIEYVTRYIAQLCVIIHLTPLQLIVTWLIYCHVSGVCMTNNTGFGFDDRIYRTFMQLATTVHKSLSDTLSFSSIGHSRLLTTFHYFTTPLYSVPSSDCALLQRLGMNPTENTVFCFQECAFIGPLSSKGCVSIVESVCFGNVFTEPLPINGVCVTIFWDLFYHGVPQSL